MIRVGVIGYGYWGPNLVRNLAAVRDVKVLAVCDRSPEQREAVSAQYPGVGTTDDAEDLFRHAEIDAVAIATPVASHYDLARRALAAGKHVWVEKPLASSSDQAAALVEEAQRRRLVLLVDHTYVYTGAVRKIHELVRAGALGQLYYYDSMRVNLGLFQHDVNVIWDLAVHDLAIVDYLFGQKPVAVSATGVGHIPDQPENVAYVTVFFPGRLIAHVHVNWLAPVKVRQALIGGSEKMILWNDVEPSEKIKVYDKGIMVSESDESRLQKLIGYRTGDMWSPQLDRTEALLVAARHFVQCIEEGKAPVSDGESGLRVVRVLEAASLSMKRGGQQVAVD